MHHVDRTSPWEEIWGAMERLVQDGKRITLREETPKLPPEETPVSPAALGVPAT